MPEFTISRQTDEPMRAAVRNFGMTAGDAVSIEFTFIETDIAPTPVPADLTGAAVTFRVRRRGCKSTEFEKSIGDGVSLAPTDGIAIVVISEDDTADLDPGAFDWQLRVTQSGSPAVFVSGTLLLRGLLEAR